MSAYYEWFRALHIISVIFWMAGLLYLPRLFIYHHSAKAGGELASTLILQERRLLRIIMNPAMIASFIFGLCLVLARPGILTGGGWIYLKLFLVFGLMGFHGILSKDRKAFEAGGRPRSEKFYRIANEAPAILTIIIVIMAVIEPF